MKLKPEIVCLVPERRQEVTTEGGLDVVGNFDSIKNACQRLGQAGIRVSLFIEPDPKTVELSALLGADAVVATRMVVADGQYTGEIEFYAYGPHKAEAMRELAAVNGYDLDTCFAYSDSHTDLPMLEAVAHPFAVNPVRRSRNSVTNNSDTAGSCSAATPEARSKAADFSASMLR